MLVNAFLIAIKEIKRNIMRSVLTTLGIIIGVASVIGMIAVGDGTTSSVKAGIEKLGTNMLILMVGQQKKGGPKEDNTAKYFDTQDIDALRAINNVAAVAVGDSSKINTIYSNKSRSISVVGTSNDYFTIKNWALEDGRFFDENELASGTSVCIIGQTVKNELFLDENPIGANIRLKNFSCNVIGLLETKGASSFGSDQDDTIIAPLTMFQRKIKGNDNINSVLISINDSKNISQAKEDIENLMRDIRNIKADEDDNFHVRDMAEMLSAMTSTTQTLTVLLGAIAGISLLVGGIGIMNIMLVSVTERTREIGTRLAIGAMEKEVMMQFLVEAIVLSTLGGIIGIIFGIAIGYFATGAMGLPFIVNYNIIFIAFLFSTLIGVVFGYFPAKKAARLNPIDALRYE